MNILKSLSYCIGLALITSCVYGERKDPFDGGQPLVVEADFVYLNRVAKIQTRCLSVIENTIVPGVYNPSAIDPSEDCCCNNVGQCKMTTKDLLHKQGFEPGVRVSLDYLKDKHTTYELRYLGLLNWNGAKSAVCTNSLAFPFSIQNDTTDYQDANKMKASLDSKLWTVDGNYWHHVTPRRVDAFSVSWLIGLRYLNFKESFNLASFTDIQKSNYLISADNRMGGIQFGGDFEGNLGRNFTWGLTAKAGGLVNFSNSDVKFYDNNNTTLIRNQNPSDFNVTFLGEFGPFFLFNLFKKVVFKLSYEVLFLSNVALAPNQINFAESEENTLNHVATGGCLFLQGLYVGLAFTF